RRARGRRLGVRALQGICGSFAGPAGVWPTRRAVDTLSPQETHGSDPRHREERPMASDNYDALHERGRSSEEEFFRREDAKLLDKLRALKNAETTRELISRATGITNKERLDKLMELKI